MYKKYTHIIAFSLLLFLYIGFFFAFLVFLTDQDYIYRPDMIETAVQGYYVQIPHELVLYVVILLAKIFYIYFFGFTLVITANIIITSIIV